MEWPMFAGEIRKKRLDRRRTHTHWKWHLDEVYVMGWTPPDGIEAPKWSCRTTTLRRGVHATGYQALSAQTYRQLIFTPR